MADFTCRLFTGLAYNVFLFMISTGWTVRYVQECPESPYEWLQRTKILKCNGAVGLTYHCLIELEGNLVEFCITPQYIPPGQEGCPWVYVHTDNEAYFPNNVISELSPCPTNNSECPQSDHGGYSTDEQYKYPSCFRNISDRFLENHKETTNVVTTIEVRPPDTDSFYQGKGAIIVVLGSLIASAFVIGGVFLMIDCIAKRKEDRSQLGEERELLDRHSYCREHEKHFRVLQAIANENLYEINKLVDEMPCLRRTGNENCTDCATCDPLIFAAHSGKMKCVERFIDIMENLDVKDIWGLTLLHYCIIHDWSDIYKQAKQKCHSLQDENNEETAETFKLVISGGKSKSVKKLSLPNGLNASIPEDNFGKKFQECRSEILEQGLRITIK